VLVESNEIFRIRLQPVARFDCNNECDFSFELVEFCIEVDGVEDCADDEEDFESLELDEL
jgi:hypothetical protein